MSKKRNNPDWRDLVAPFAWLITRVLFRIFKRRWVADPKIPITKASDLDEDEEE